MRVAILRRDELHEVRIFLLVVEKGVEERGIVRRQRKIFGRIVLDGGG